MFDIFVQRYLTVWHFCIQHFSVGYFLSFGLVFFDALCAVLLGVFTLDIVGLVVVLFNVASKNFELVFFCSAFPH